MSELNLMKLARDADAAVTAAEKQRDHWLKKALPKGKRVLFRNGNMIDCASAEITRVGWRGYVQALNLETGKEQDIHYSDIKLIWPDPPPN